MVGHLAKHVGALGFISSKIKTVNQRHWLSSGHQGCGRKPSRMVLRQVQGLPRPQVTQLLVHMSHGLADLNKGWDVHRAFSSSHHMGGPLLARRHPQPAPHSNSTLLLVWLFCPSSLVSHFLLGCLGWSLVSTPYPVQTVNFLCRKSGHCYITQACKEGTPPQSLEPLSLLYLQLQEHMF